MLNILIVEDDTEQLKLLTDIISRTYTEWVVKTAENYNTAKTYVDESIQTHSPFSLFLLDIPLTEQPGDRGGFFLAKEIRQHACYFRVPILFLTAISDEGSFALSEFHCYNYITKPYLPGDILFQLEQMLFTGYLETSLNINDTNRILHKVFINEIFAVESKSHVLVIHTLSGDIFTRDFTLEKFKKQLDYRFVQCHRRVIINKEFLKSYDRVCKYVKIENMSFPVSRSFQQNLITL